jgi:hypothetical protein
VSPAFPSRKAVFTQPRDSLPVAQPPKLQLKPAGGERRCSSIEQPRSNKDRVRAATPGAFCDSEEVRAIAETPVYGSNNHVPGLQIAIFEA